ncbi:MAG: NifU family protein [Chloroflexota bacterium]|nr:NifU family protein [Chloroflexota bacterium]
MAREIQKEEEVRTLVAQISAYIEQYHGGSAELVSFENTVATVRLGGACLGCPLSASTLKGWVQGTVHQFFPEVEVVAAEEEN